MNTQQLQKDFPEVYEEFFSKYDLIVSSPIVNSFNGIGVYPDTSTYAGIGYKIPLRNYLGIKLNGEKTNVISYTFKKNSIYKFITTSTLEKDYPINIGVLRSNGLIGELGVLSEYSRIDYPSIVTNFILVDTLVSGKISLNEMDNFDINKNYQEIMPIITNHPFVNALKSMLVRDFGTVLLSSCTHMIFYKNDQKKINKDIISDSISHSLDLNHFIINMNRNPTYRPDLNLVKNLQYTLQNFSKTTKLFSPLSDLTECYGTLSLYITLDLIQSLEQLYTPDKNDYSIFKKMESYNSTRAGIQGLDTAYSEILYLLRKYLLEKVKLEPNFTLFVGGQRTHLFTPKRAEFNASHLDGFNSQQGTNFTLDYSSLEDGMEFTGSKIEQRTSKGIFSKFHKKFICYEVVEDKLSISNYCIEKEIPKKGLVLDSHTNKIYLNGDPVNSKEIFSQKGTIEIIGVLIQNFGKDITNKDLPASSYAKNKNTLVGKILLPLQKILEQSGLGKIGITAKGSLYSYTLCMKHTAFSIYYNTNTR